MAPAEVEMLSLMSVPMKSLAPALRPIWASFGPSLTHETWMFLIQLLSMIRDTAYIFTTSAPVAPGRPFGTRLLLYIGASVWRELSGTNAVKPPPPEADPPLAEVCVWISRSTAMCCALWRESSMWPYMIVEVVGMPRRCAVDMTSIHWSVVMRPAEMMS